MPTALYKTPVVTALTAVGAMKLFHVLVVLIGFTAGGVQGGSLAAAIMSLYKGAISAGSIVSILQSIGAAGISLGSYIQVGSIAGLLASLLHKGGTTNQP
ncbi:hypothetical protein BGZ73_008811 [Actinomortierella ambigua]|nr:hypothetical protein BGZ73_008811 [Actinomortierella ambigua]